MYVQGGGRLLRGSRDGRSNYPSGNENRKKTHELTRVLFHPPPPTPFSNREKRKIHSERHVVRVCHARSKSAREKWEGQWGKYFLCGCCLGCAGPLLVATWRGQEAGWELDKHAARHRAAGSATTSSGVWPRSPRSETQRNAVPEFEAGSSPYRCMENPTAFQGHLAGQGPYTGNRVTDFVHVKKRGHFFFGNTGNSSVVCGSIPCR